MAIMIVMPKLGMVMSEGTISKWMKDQGSPVNQGDVIAEIETEKINYELEATESGFLHQIADEGSVVAVNGLVGYILAEGEAVPESPVETAPKPRRSRRKNTRQNQPNSQAQGAPVKSTPGARTLAAKLSVDLSQVSPTGPGGRIIEKDVRKHSERAQGPSSIDAPTPVGMPAPVSTEPMSGIRKSIATHMRGSLASTAQLSFSLEVDITDAQKVRKEKTSETDGTISMAHVLMRAAGGVLKKLSKLNTILTDEGIHYFDEINIGVAVALKEGLIVPVVKGIDQKSIGEIARTTTDLAEKARDGNLTPDELAGGTFTISVLGSVDSFTPVLNAGQSAIMGVGRSVEKPVVKAGEVVIREMMTISLTVDHQVIDGAVAAEFMRRLKQSIERPAPLFK